MRFLFLLTTLASPAFAACPDTTETAFACTFSSGSKAVDVCHNAETVSYAFGRPGRTPELSLSVPMTQVEYQPWPGIGRAIWETVTFRSGDVSYTVFGNIDRPVEEGTDPEVTGGIEVRRGEAVLATLRCDPGSVSFAYGDGLYDAKTAAGQCWDPGTEVWSACQ